MKRLLLILSCICVIAGVLGGCFVYYTEGHLESGYVIIPLLLALVFSQGYMTLKRKQKKD